MAEGVRPGPREVENRGVPRGREREPERQPEVLVRRSTGGLLRNPRKSRESIPPQKRIAEIPHDGIPEVVLGVRRRESRRGPVQEPQRMERDNDGRDRVRGRSRRLRGRVGEGRWVPREEGHRSPRVPPEAPSRQGLAFHVRVLRRQDDGRRRRRRRPRRRSPRNARGVQEARSRRARRGGLVPTPQQVRQRREDRRQQGPSVIRGLRRSSPSSPSFR
mmetsp:Transcript_2565/g.6951  ORF Transcript_2565/g.6951 Transcript_2565/m.6951 type:complete len:218 (+) Transcript_2565:526-1179(+)